MPRLSKRDGVHGGNLYGNDPGPAITAALNTVNGIFDNEYFEVDPLSGVGVVSAQPRFVCTTADLPSGATSGDAITIDGTAYTVRVIQPEGTGVTTVVLEKD